MPAEIKKKFDAILAREKQMAKSIALKAMPSKPLSVWEVLIPVVFILGYMRSKADRDIFSQNMLFTKKMALEAALDMLKTKKSKAAALMQIELKTKELLCSLPDGIYSDDIRQEQLGEINLLIDHYALLLGAGGEDYASLVVSSYRTGKDYALFNDMLASAEKKVTEAARQTLGHQADNDMAAKIEKIIDDLRRKEVETIFGPHRRH